MIVFYSIDLSPHIQPLALEVAKIVGFENFLYVSEIEEPWRGEAIETGGILHKFRKDASQELEDCEVLYTGGIRPIDLIERRARRGLKTLYVSERWFKPIRIGAYFCGFRLGFSLPGWLRMYCPGYRKMMKRFVRAVNEHDSVRFLAIGPHAKADFVRMGVREGKIDVWGYFVEESLVVSRQSLVGSGQRLAVSSERLAVGSERLVLRVLWVGRMLDWKRVDTIIRAVGELVRSSNPRLTTNDYRLTTTLDIYGAGPEEKRLRKMAAKYGDVIKFHAPVPIREVRGIMREHDVYVLSSDENEGWGAVVNEALSEGMKVLGTFEAGASATMLPGERLFHAGDAEALARLLVKEANNELPPCSIGNWTPKEAARRLVVSR